MEETALLELRFVPRIHPLHISPDFVCIHTTRSSQRSLGSPLGSILVV